MNLLLINYEYPPIGGGAANATWHLARSFRSLGHPVSVLTSAFGPLRGPSDEEGISVWRAPSRRSKREAASPTEMVSYMAHAARRVRRLIREREVQGVIAFFSIPSAPVAWWGTRGSDIPYLVSLRGGDVPGAEASLRAIHCLLAPLRRKMLRDARAVVANSPGLKAMAESADGLPVAVIPNGVDAGFFSPAELPASGERSVPMRLLFVGRFQEQKNLPWLLRQLAALGPRINWSLELVGDGPQRASLAAQAQGSGISPQVRFHGWIERPALRALYQTADALLLPSRYEGMPNVALEAMACGLPVIASRVAGNESVIIDRETGRLFGLDDPVEFREAIGQLAADRETGSRWGAAARARVVREFSWDSVASAYLDLIQPARKHRS